MFELTIHFHDVDPKVLTRCIEGETVSMWTTTGVDEVYFYARRTVGGAGCIGKVPDDQAPILMENLASATATIVRIANGDCEVLCVIDDAC